MTVVCHTAGHLFAAAVASPGPSSNSPQFPQAMGSAARQTSFDRLLGDAGYDGEHNHRVCREGPGIRSTVIPLNKRRTGRTWPTTKYRRQVKQRFHKRLYRNRWQVESALSRSKRLLDSFLRARTEAAKGRECSLRILTRNLMVVRLFA